MKEMISPCRTCNNQICKKDLSPCDELNAVLPSMYDGEHYKIAEVNENTPISSPHATAFPDSPRKQEFEAEFEYQSSIGGFQPRPLTPATANAKKDWKRLKELVEKALLRKHSNSKKLTSLTQAKAYRRSAQFAAYMRCWTVRDIASASNQPRQTIHDQLNETLRKCGEVLVEELGLPEDKYKKTMSIKNFKDTFNQGTYK